MDTVIDMIRFCRDCANYEERRDIDGTALCKKQEPSICRDEFSGKEIVHGERYYNRACPECKHFEVIKDTPLCTKNHEPGVACGEFFDRLEALKPIQQHNMMKTILLIHALKYQPSQGFPHTY